MKSIQASFLFSLKDQKRNLWRMLLFLLFIILLAACGGDDEGGVQRVQPRATPLCQMPVRSYLLRILRVCWEAQFLHSARSPKMACSAIVHGEPKPVRQV